MSTLAKQVFNDVNASEVTGKASVVICDAKSFSPLQTDSVSLSRIKDSQKIFDDLKMNDMRRDMSKSFSRNMSRFNTSRQRDQANITRRFIACIFFEPGLVPWDGNLMFKASKRWLRILVNASVRSLCSKPGTFASWYTLIPIDDERLKSCQRNAWHIGSVEILKLGKGLVWVSASI